eukprot:PhF_6_TR4459/c0_g1_i1/m.6052
MDRIHRDPFDSMWFQVLRSLHRDNSEGESLARALGVSMGHCRSLATVVIQYLRWHQHNGTQLEARRKISCLLDGVHMLPPKQVRSSLVDALYHASVQLGRWEDAVKLHSIHHGSSALTVHRLLNPENALNLVEWATRSNVLLPHKEVVSNLNQTLIHYESQWKEVVRVSVGYDLITTPRGLSTSVMVSTPYLARLGVWSIALNMFRRAVFRGVQISADVVAAVCSCCTNVGQWMIAMRLLRSYAERSPEFPPLDFARMVSSVVGRGNWRAGLEMLRKQSPELDDRSFAEVLRSTQSGPHWSLSLKAFAIVVNANPDSSASKYNVFLKTIQENSGMSWSQGLSALCWMEHAGMAANAAGYDTLMSLCDNTQWVQAIRTYQVMNTRKIQPLYSTLRTLLKMCTSSKRWEQAFSIYSKMHEYHATMRSVEPSASQLVTVQHCVHSAGRWDLNVYLYSSWTHGASALSGNVALEGCRVGGLWGTGLRIALGMHNHDLQFSVSAAGLVVYAFRKMGRPSNYAKCAGRAAKLLKIT